MLITQLTLLPAGEIVPLVTPYYDPQGKLLIPEQPAPLISTPNVYEGNEVDLFLGAIQIYIAARATAFMLSIFIGLYTGKRWNKNHPDKRGYKWGHIFAFTYLLSAIILTIIGTYSVFISSKLHGVNVALFTISIISVFLSYGIFRRNRWFWVLSTILTWNAVIWIINISYIRNRWAEFKEQGNRPTEFKVQDKGITIKFLAKLMLEIKSNKLAVFIATIYAVSIPTIVILFEPYGHDIEDTKDWIPVVVLPIILGFCFYWIYKRFIK